MKTRDSARLLAVVVTAISLGGCVPQRSQSPVVEAGRHDAPARPSPARTAAVVDRINESSSLDECLAYAALRSPRLEAAYYRWLAALERVPQARALPDPSVSYAYYIESVETRVGPQEHAAGLKQTIPWLGKLARRGDIRAEEARAEYERYQAAKLDLFYEIKEIYFELYYLRSAIELTRDNMELLAQFERIARARYRVAAASHPDVVRAQVELGRIEDRLRGLEDLRRPLAASLNAVLNRPSGSSVPWPAEVSAPRFDFADDEVLERARRTNPRLRALDRDIERDRYAERLARLDFIPDFTLGVDYIVTDDARMSGTPDSGQDAVIGRVSFNVPLWFQKYTAAEREAVNRRAATTRHRVETANSIASEVERALYDVRDAGRKIELFRDSLIPKAEESLRASLRGFESGRLGFLDLLDAERVLLEFQLLERRAISHEAQGLARLQMLAGDELAAAPGTPDKEAVR